MSTQVSNLSNVSSMKNAKVPPQCWDVPQLRQSGEAAAWFPALGSQAAASLCPSLQRCGELESNQRCSHAKWKQELAQVAAAAVSGPRDSAKCCVRPTLCRHKNQEQQMMHCLVWHHRHATVLPSTGHKSNIIIIIMYIYHALINALIAHMIHINLNMIFYTHVEHSPTKIIYIKYY